MSERYALILPVRLTHELEERTRNKPFLANRIPRDVVNLLIQALTDAADTVMALDEPFPQVGRDRKDDYLFAHAVIGRADFLVSGDRDVLAVGPIGDVRIVSPAAFVEILCAAGRI